MKDDLEDLEDVISATADDPLRIVVETDEDPRIVTPTDESGTRLNVSRRTGICDHCDTPGVQTISAYDPAVYQGWICGPCILAGNSGSEHRVDSRVMLPMVFVARALAGDEPYRTLLKAADAQREHPERAEEIGEVAKTRLREEKRLRRLGLIPHTPHIPRNRRERRLATRQARKRTAKRKVADKCKVAKDKSNGATQLDDFEAFAGGFK